MQGQLDILAGHCADAGRDMAEIEKTVSFPMIIRGTVEAAKDVRRSQLAANGIPEPDDIPTLTGPPEMIAEAFRPYRELGFSTVIARMPAPFDRETIDRLPEVIALLS